MKKSVVITEITTIEDNPAGTQSIQGVTTINIEAAPTSEEVDAVEARERFNNLTLEESPPRRTRLLSDLYEMCTFALRTIDPVSYNEATKSEEWKIAMK